MALILFCSFFFQMMVLLFSFRGTTDVFKVKFDLKMCRYPEFYLFPSLFQYQLLLFFLHLYFCLTFSFAFPSPMLHLLSSPLFILYVSVTLVSVCQAFLLFTLLIFRFQNTFPLVTPFVSFLFGVPVYHVTLFFRFILFL